MTTTTIKEKFRNFRIFQQDGVEYMKLGQKCYQVIRPSRDQLILLPILNTQEVAAKRKYYKHTHYENKFLEATC